MPLALTFMLLVASALPAAWADTGWVEIRVTDHRAGIGDFDAFWVQLAQVSLHPRGRPRGQSWVAIMQQTAAVDIVPLKHGRWFMLGRMSVPATRYDAVKVRFGDVRGELRQGGLAEVVPHDSTVLVDVTVEPETSRIILIDLYVEDLSDHQRGQYAVKVREIQANDAAYPQVR